jgi:hypothetical protein
MTQALDVKSKIHIVISSIHLGNIYFLYLLIYIQFLRIIAKVIKISFIKEII